MEENKPNKSAKMAEYRQNIYVFLGLAVLTVLEFLIAINLEQATVPLLIIAIIKAGLIVQFFMHIYRIWQAEEHE